MQIHLAEQNPSEALRQYAVVRRLLRDGLGLPQSPATRAVVAELLGRGADRTPNRSRFKDNVGVGAARQTRRAPFGTGWSNPASTTPASS